MGGCLGNTVYACPIPSYIVLDEKLFIVHLEMLNVLIALRLWADRVTIYCDNAAGVSVIGTGKSRDLFLAAVTHNIWLITSMWDIELNIEHTPGRDNTAADVLSQWFLPNINRNTLYESITDPEWLVVPEQAFAVDYSI